MFLWTCRSFWDSLILDSSVGLSAGIHSVCWIFGFRDPGSNPAFSRGRQRVSFRLKKSLAYGKILKLTTNMYLCMKRMHVHIYISLFQIHHYKIQSSRCFSAKGRLLYVYLKTKITFQPQKIIYIIVFAIIIINVFAIATVNIVTVINIVVIIVIMIVIVLNVIIFSRKSYVHYRRKDKLRPVLYWSVSLITLKIVICDVP